MFPIMAPLPEELRHLDPDAGVLVSTTYWRPQFQATDPEHPGEKALVLSYLPTAAEDRCPCGSGKRFRSCCQPLPYWRILCPNPDLHGYRQVRPQTARFSEVSLAEVAAVLDSDERLYIVDDDFWTYWGDPAFDAPLGTLCFGDLEVQEQTLLITALSDLRMEFLLTCVSPLGLPFPQRKRESFLRMPKPR